jgi:hypothetical protein
LDSVVVLFKWLHYSPDALAVLRDRLMPPLLSLFDKRIQEIVKKFADPSKKEELMNSFKKSITEKTTFDDNIADFFKKTYPRAQSIENIAMDRLEEDISPAPYQPYQRGTNDNSFQDQSGAQISQIQKSSTVPLGSKKLVVPMLNLPTSNNRDSNPTIISRSTRRHEMLNKSSVSTSNRLVNAWGTDGTTQFSRDSSLRDRRISVGAYNDANMSYLDDQADAYYVIQPTNLPVVDAF